MTKETMTSRERVVRMLNHEPVDRYPIDLGAHPSTGISAFAYHRLREYLGLSTDSIWVYDAVQFLAYVDGDVRERFHLDLICLEPKWDSTMEWTPRGDYRFAIPSAMNPVLGNDGSYTVRQGNHSMRMPQGGYFFDGSWLSNWGSGDEETSLAEYAREAERIFKETPYATMFTGYGRGMSFGAFFGGIDRAVQMMLEPDGVKAENEAILKSYLNRLGRIIDRLGPYVQVLSLADDMGLQAGPACRPSVIEDCVMPYLKRFCDFVHANSDIKVFLHNCGGIEPLIPMLIEAGVDVLNPVQVSAAGMDADELARKYGGRITFWGGACDTQNVLGVKSPDEVRENTGKLVEAFKPTNGFVFNPVHNIMGDVPPENVVALYDEGYRRGFYA